MFLIRGIEKDVLHDSGLSRLYPNLSWGTGFPERLHVSPEISLLRCLPEDALDPWYQQSDL